MTLLAPSPPLLFMGEEWGATQPFPFFCDFKGDLGGSRAQRPPRGIRSGLRERHGRETIPDPLAEATFRSAVLDWSAARTASRMQRGSTLVRALLAARREHIVPLLRGIDARKRRGAAFDDGVLYAQRGGSTANACCSCSPISTTQARQPAHRRRE